VFVGPAPS
jgi:hypothetical protein